jgi:hypothetical protein
MKLRTIKEGHWDLSPDDYPGLIPSLRGKFKRPKRHSFLLNPDDRERFINWSKGKNPKN